jgi:Alginate export
MRHAWLISISLVLASNVMAANFTTPEGIPLTPPSYQVLRFDENYSCFSNSVNRTDFIDPIKYIPLRANDPSWYLTVGGEVRERFEGYFNDNFGIGGAEPDYHLLQRLTLLTDWHLGERVRFFASGISALQFGGVRPAPPVQQDPIDLEYAFMDFVPYLTDDERLTLRAGRFGMSFGSGRLVSSRAAPNAPNIPFRFDGLEMLYTRPLWEATAFLTQPAADTGGINGEDHSTTFWGLYVTHWFDVLHTLGLDLYYLGIYNRDATYASGTADETRHSLGTRQFGLWKGWAWNAEEVLQVGSFGDQSILAWTASLDTGYTFPVALQPRLGVNADVASGNTHPGDGTQGTFNALYFMSGYFNDASLFRPQNIIDVHPMLGLQLTRTLSVDGGGDVFWRYARNDAIYNPPDFIIIPANNTASSYLGTAADINFTWRIQRHFSLGLSYVHFFTGGYIHQAGGSDLDFLSTTFSFLF